MNTLNSILLAVAVAGSPLAQAATFTVTSLADSGAGTLRDRIAQANTATGAPHVVNFQAGLGGTIALNSPIRISNSMTISGPGAAVLTIDGQDATRLFDVRRTSGNPRSVAINGLTMTGGLADEGGAIYAYDEDLSVGSSIFRFNSATLRGGAIFAAEADLSLDGVSVLSNSAPSTGQGSGGGIYFSAGTLTLARSIIAQNTANFGAGLRITSPRANAVITDSLIQDNVAGHTGGGIYAGTMTSLRMSASAVVANSTGEPQGGGMYFTGVSDAGAATSVIENSTFSANVTRHQSGQGSALSVSGGKLLVRNSTFAFNKCAPTLSPTAGVKAGAIWVDTTGTTVSLESTLFGANTQGIGNVAADLAHVSGSASNPSIVNVSDSLFATMPDAAEINGSNLRNQFAADALLKPLTSADGGGFVPVHPVSRLSPAIDRGSNSGALTWDQRGNGFVRAWTDSRYRNDPVFSRPDIGAYEYRGDGLFVGDFEQQ